MSTKIYGASDDLMEFDGAIRDLLLIAGAVTIMAGALLALTQQNMKRMLAYSSVEHMGVLAFGSGLGTGAGAAMLHAVNHSLAKAMLFLTAGNILAAGRTKSVGEVRGLLRALPLSGALWLIGFLAISGSPPFGPFVSELWILKGALDGRQWASASLYVALLAVVFVGMATVVLKMSHGEPSDKFKTSAAEEDPWRLLPPVGLAAAVLALGLWVPRPLLEAVRDAAIVLGAR